MKVNVQIVQNKFLTWLQKNVLLCNALILNTDITIRQATSVRNVLKIQNMSIRLNNVSLLSLWPIPTQFISTLNRAMLPNKIFKNKFSPYNLIMLLLHVTPAILIGMALTVLTVLLPEMFKIWMNISPILIFLLYNVKHVTIGIMWHISV